MKVAIDTYGCTRNKSDEELIKGQIEKDEKLEETKDIDEADTVILNTCGVKNKTQSKMINRLKRYRKKGKKVLVTGCLPRINTEILEEHEAAMTDPNTIEKIPEALEKIKKGKKPVYTSEKRGNKLEEKKKIRKGITGILPIAEGCLGNCSYCGVKKARGNLYSYPENSIIEEIKRLIQKGKKQIYLTSQDTGCYGLDKKDTNLPKLIRKITEIDEEFKLRIGMMNPEHLKKQERRKELIKSMKNPKIYKFIHLPIQSGSNKVLKDMNRKYTVEEFKKIAGDLEKNIKELNLATDVIVGYPTEKEKHFQETIKLIKEIKPDVTNISRFHPRPNTEAEKLEPHNSQVLKKRSKKLSQITQKISKNKNKQYIDKEKEVMITELTKNKITARTNNYKKVRIQENKEKDKNQLKELEKGNKIKVNVISVGSRGLKGEIVK